MRKIFLFLAITLCFQLYAQTPPSIQWQKTFGGTGAEEIYSIQQTFDGGYIVSGESSSNDGDISGHHGSTSTRDYLVAKLDQFGNKVWQKSLGGTDHETSFSIRQNDDGGYIVVGATSSINGDVVGNHGNSDCWVIRLSENGDVLWKKTFGGSYQDYGTSGHQTADGGFIIAALSESNDGDVIGHHGSTNNSDYWILKLDADGNIEWQKSLGGDFGDVPNYIEQTNDGGYIIVGNSSSENGDVTGNHGFIDYWVVKINSTGIIEWQRSYGGSAEDYGRSIKQTSDGGYIVVGFTTSVDGDVTDKSRVMDRDYWALKLGNTGQIIWTKSLGGSDTDMANSVYENKDNEYIIAGHSSSSNGDVNDHYGLYNSDFWIVKVSNSGNVVWKKSYGGSSTDNAYAVQQTLDGGYVVAGTTYSNDIDVNGNHGWSDGWILKLNMENLATEEYENTKFKIYPNPVKDIINFSEKLFNIKLNDISGKVIKQFSGSVKSLNLSDLPKGIYIITADTKSGKRLSEKFIKE